MPNLALRLENTAFHCEMALREALNMTDAQDASDACTVAARVSDMETYSDTEANWGLISEIFAVGELARDVAFFAAAPRRAPRAGKPRRRYSRWGGKQYDSADALDRLKSTL